ncbi:MAG: hypothetical protein Q6354_08845, partial [Candidatus Brocadiales bacterium]|nr:hypothetical protein [Candidatus Brocadiales bacterium]
MAPKIIKKSAVIGAFSGLGLALLVILLVWLNKEGREPLQTITNFFVSVPTLLVANLPGRLQILV